MKITTWFRVAAWGKIGENCSKYLAKGKLVMVLGYLNPDPETGGPRAWMGEDGSPRASYELTASTVKFLSPSDHHAAAEPAELGSSEEIPY